MIQKTALQVIRQERSILSLLLLMTILNSLSMVGQAWYFAMLINNFIFLDHTVYDEQHTLMMLIIMIAIRLGSFYYIEHLAETLGGRAKDILRKRAMTHLFSLGIQQKATQGDTIHLLTDGLEQVDAYVARYLPQILYAVIIPLVMGLAIIDAMPVIGVILILTVPLIPFFMILIGKQAEKMNQEQWERMSLLSGHFLDVLRGIMTLKVFGRSKEQIDVIGRLSEEFKDSTLKVLRVAFLSALVLEMVSTISTAIIAVYMGLTLLEGGISFFPAFFILLLAPEFYAPFRQLGAAFHTGMAGKASLEKFDAFMATVSTLPKGGRLCITEPLEHIELQDLTYTYNGTDNGVHHISLIAKRNEPIMLVGESGAGKSTIGHLVAGFLEAPGQSIFINGMPMNDLSMDWWRSQIAYVSQKPHIMNGTLRDVIAFGRPVSDEEIIKAAEQAELTSIIKEKGLDFLIGEGGAGLSGGELQRISLARAFLQQPQVLILDEVTAHLDVNTEAAIGKALQRLLHDKIVILIGHRLKTMHWAKELYVLKAGAIVEQGTYEELLGNNGYFHSLVQAGMGNYVTYVDDVDSLTLEETQSGGVQSNLVASTDGFDSDKEFIEKQWVSAAEEHSRYSENQTSYEITRHQQIYKNGSILEGLRLLLSVLSPSKWSLLLAFIFTFLTVFMNVGLLSVSAWLLASAALQPGITYLSLAIVGVRFFGISRAVSRYFERYTSHRMAFQGLYGLRVWFYTHLEPLLPAFFNRWAAGDMLGRIMADIEVLQFFYLRTLIPPLAAIVLTIIVGYGVGTIDPVLSLLVVIAAIITGIVLPYAVYRYHRQSLELISVCQSHLKSRLSDALEGMEDIISYNRIPLTTTILSQYMDDIEHHKGHISKGMNLGNTAFMGIVQITVIVAAVIAANALTAPWASVMVAVCAIGIQAWFEALQPMIIAFHHGYESTLAVRRLLDIKEAAPAIIDNHTVEGKTMTTMDSITIKDVSFSYTSEYPIYEQMNLTIPKGQKVAIVGASGSGKTTLFSLLERLYDYDGTILIGSTDLKSIAIDSWRQLLGTITQQTYIFHATLADNIRLANPKSSDAHIERVVEAAALSDVVKALPLGLESIVGNGGVGLSGGERQRVALARLFLKNPDLILLDEPLEGLDQVTRETLQHRIMEFTEHKTLLYITHQLDGLEEMDRIIFMNHGKIVEDGTYEELIALRGQFYNYCLLSMARIL